MPAHCRRAVNLSRNAQKGFVQFPERPEPTWLPSVWMCADQRALRTIVRQMSVLCSGNRELSCLVKEKEPHWEIVKMKWITRATHAVEDIKKAIFLGEKMQF